MTRPLIILTLLAVVAGAGGCKKKSSTSPSGTVTSVVVSGNASYVNKNQTSQLTATANMSGGAPQDVTSTATWTISAPAIASVSAAGLVTALGHGAAVISAESGGKTGTLAIAVALKAQPQLTLVFTRLCGPFRAKVDATIAETSVNGGFNINSLRIVMRNFFDVVQYDHTFTPAEISGVLGTNHINAGQSRVISATATYAGSVDTEDSKPATATLSTTDDFGNTVTTEASMRQFDGC
jgi:hypothetical protein